jgi:hypothetical protein
MSFIKLKYLFGLLLVNVNFIYLEFIKEKILLNSVLKLQIFKYIFLNDLLENVLEVHHLLVDLN